MAHLPVIYPCWQGWCSCSNTTHQRNPSQASTVVKRKPDVTMNSKGCRNQIFNKPVTHHRAYQIQRNATVYSSWFFHWSSDFTSLSNSSTQAAKAAQKQGHEDHEISGQLQVDKVGNFEESGTWSGTSSLNFPFVFHFTSSAVASVDSIGNGLYKKDLY